MNLNGAIGTLHCFVKTPSGTDDDVFSQELDQDEHAMRFMPRENGVYYVNITFNEAHIPGSPFPMLVGKLGADPALVIAKGDGLEKGEVGTLFTTSCLFITFNSLGPFHGAIVVPSVTHCRCRRRGHRCAGGVRRDSSETW